MSNKRSKGKSPKARAAHFSQPEYAPYQEQIAAMLEPGYDFNQHGTAMLLGWLRSEEGRNNLEWANKLKEVLATRPHLLTRAETKKIRQEKAKQQRNR